MSLAPAQPIARGSNLPGARTSQATWPSNWLNAWIPLEAWSQFNGLDTPVRLGATPKPTFQIRSPHRVMDVKVGSRTAYCDGLECWLNHAPQLINGTPYIHWLDAKKTFQPLVSHASFGNGHQPAIVIDPGHGGKDGGTRSCLNGAFEKEYTLDWARRLQALLEKAGWNVTLTRSNDVDVPLSTRVAVAEQAKADLFLSLHFNSGEPNREMAGLETYCLTPTGMTSHLSRGYEDNPTQTYPNNVFDDQNLQVAFALHRAVLNQTQAVDRGLRRARFMTVLRGQNRPAVLIEAGYLSNPTEAQRIATPDYREALAEAVAKAANSLLPASVPDYASGSVLPSAGRPLR
jgi:N-acetylmuramoyl-L-alanine amidase